MKSNSNPEATLDCCAVLCCPDPVCIWELYPFPGVVITKYHNPRGLNSKHGFPHRSGGWKFEIKAVAGLVPSEAEGESGLSPLSLWTVVLFPWRPLCVSVPKCPLLTRTRTLTTAR